MVGKTTPIADVTFNSDTVIFPGSFNPLHKGHETLASVAEAYTKKNVIFEITASHPDKGNLSEEELTKRINQFKSRDLSVVITHASFYADKAKLFPCCAFLVGADTFSRIFSPKYYGSGSVDDLAKMIQGLRTLKCTFVVAGRKDKNGTFKTAEHVLADLKSEIGSKAVEELLEGMFDAIPESEFRVDMSSTELRARKSTPERIFGRYISKKQHDGRFRDVSVPCFMFRGRLDTSVLRWMIRAPVFEASQANIEKNPNFRRCVDYPRIPGHGYFEGYFHSLPTGKAIRSIDPRKGSMVEKSAAPLRLAAFYEGCRRKNRNGLVSALKANLSSLPETSPGQETILDIVKRGWLFGDVAAQIHFGDSVVGNDIGWHVDAPNSTIHLAISVAGARKLHAKIGTLSSSTSSSKTGDDESVAATPSVSEHVLSLEAGDIYLTSPANFSHAVSYDPSSTTWEDRIIAVQARFMMTSDDLHSILGCGDTGAWFETMEAITSAMISTPFSLPTLEECVQIADEISKKRKEEAKSCVVS
eukprot:g4539.t1